MEMTNRISASTITMVHPSTAKKDAKLRVNVAVLDFGPRQDEMSTGQPGSPAHTLTLAVDLSPVAFAEC